MNLFILSIINNYYAFLSGDSLHQFLQNVYIMIKGLFFNQGDSCEK
jgi:hypothetical protein